jgi:hypothetical protein
VPGYLADKTDETFRELTDILQNPGRLGEGSMGTLFQDTEPEFRSGTRLGRVRHGTIAAYYSWPTTTIMNESGLGFGLAADGSSSSAVGR